jgi:hypothetical protein
VAPRRARSPAACSEVNDNPNLDAGVEDKVLGDGLYRAILAEMVARLERQRSGRRG